MAATTSTLAPARGGSAPGPRPPMERQTTDASILSYYYQNSPDLAREHRPEPTEPTENDAQRARALAASPDSLYSDSSASDYERAPRVLSPSATIANTVVPAGSARVQRRLPSSSGGMDKRRLAIVELDSQGSSRQSSVRGPRSPGSGPPSSASPTAPAGLPTPTGPTLQSRRGHDTALRGLALVAPPDADPLTFTNLSPPSTAPASVRSVFDGSGSNMPSPDPSLGLAPSPLHHRSMSDLSSAGARPSLPPSVRRQASRDSPRTERTPPTLAPPTFSTPTRHSAGSPDVDQTPTQHRFQPARTPDIGERKEPHMPVVGPVVVDLATSAPSHGWLSTGMAAPSAPIAPTGAGAASHTVSASGSHYLHYLPGRDATAGPLPPPPRALFDIDKNAPPPPRPPRVTSPPPPKSPFRRKMELKDQEPRPAMPTLARRDTDFSFVAASNASSDDETRSETSSAADRNGRPSHIREAAIAVSNVSSPEADGGFVAPAVALATASARETRLERSRSRDVQVAPGRLTAHTVLVEPPTPASPDSKDLPMPNSAPSTTTSFPTRSTSLRHISPSRRSQSSSRASSDSGHVPPMPPMPSIHERHRSETMSPPMHMQVPSGHSGHRRQASTRSDGSDSQPSRSNSPSGLLSRATSRGSEQSQEPARTSTTPTSLKRTMSKWKRFSALPRTPSRSSSRTSSAPSRSSRAQSRAQSPVPAPPPHSFPQPPRRIQRTVSAWPAAMQFADVTTKRSALERSIGYAQKINELYQYDCGLSNWVAHTTGTRDHKKLGTSTAVDLSQRRVTAQPQARVVSNSSVRSNATFPIRADAYLATDLGVKLSDVKVLEPALPYPALASAPPRPVAPPIQTSFSSVSSASSNRSVPKSAGGFFSSIGRKTSTRRERVGLLSPTLPALPSNRLSKSPKPSPPLVQSISNPAPAPAPSVVPGGPRSAPHRAQRSQTLMLSSSPLNEPTAGPPQASARRSAASPRLSPEQTHARPDWEANHDFARQVGKLADLLPHADRAVLAGYLRRAGSDLVAVGQYIEDEKNGTIRRD